MKLGGPWEQMVDSDDRRVRDILEPFLIGVRDTELAQIARVAGVSERNLKTLSLLYLPRLALRSSLDANAVRTEIWRLADCLRRRSCFDSEAEPMHPGVDDLTEFEFSEISERKASSTIRKYHYLGTSRSDSVHFGLNLALHGKRQVYSLLTLSPYDLWHISLPAGIAADQAVVISRIFAFDTAPKNAISYMIGNLTRWLRRQKPSTRFVLTYVDPAMGFSGASYRAANFSLYGYEVGTRYCYVDGFYVTDRELKSRYGTFEPALLAILLRNRFEVVEDLPPLHIYSRALDHRVKIDREPRIFIRPQR